MPLDVSAAAQVYSRKCRRHLLAALRVKLSRVLLIWLGSTRMPIKSNSFRNKSRSHQEVRSIEDIFSPFSYPTHPLDAAFDSRFCREKPVDAESVEL